MYYNEISHLISKNPAIGDTQELDLYNLFDYLRDKGIEDKEAYDIIRKFIGHMQRYYGYST